MTIKEFFDAYLGLWIETNKSSDESTNDQCVDLWRAYNRKVIGAPDVYGNAKDFWENYPSDFYDRISNTPTGVPQLGDVMIWGTSYGKYGHIAICTDIADVKTFTSFDQNDPIDEPCHYQPHNYAGLLGWLRPKNQSAIYGEEKEEKGIITELIEKGFEELPESDNLKDGNLEGYVRALIGEHPKVIPDAEKNGTDAQVITLKEHLEDISKALKMPLSENKVDDMVKRIVELKTTEQNYIKFVEYVAESIDSPEKTETAVRTSLMSFSSLKNDIKKRRLEDFTAWERIFSGLGALLKRR